MKIETRSKILSEKHLIAIERIGDIIIPQTENFPSFSQLGCIEYIDDIVSFAPADDTEDLKTLLITLYNMPDSMLNLIVKLMNDPTVLPESLAKTVRLVDTGLRGIIFTLYYSGKEGENYIGKNPLEIIGYDINRI